MGELVMPLVFFGVPSIAVLMWYARRKHMGKKLKEKRLERKRRNLARKYAEQACDAIDAGKTLFIICIASEELEEFGGFNEFVLALHKTRALIEKWIKVTPQSNESGMHLLSFEPCIERASRCCGAPIKVSYHDEVTVATCTACNMPVIRVNPWNLSKREWLDYHPIYTDIELEEVK